MFKVNLSQHTRWGPNIRVEHLGKITNKSDTFAVKGSEIFNNLPIELKSPLLTDKQFKTKLKPITKARYLLATH